MFSYAESMQASEVQRQYLADAEQRRQLADARRASRRSRRNRRNRT